MANYKDVIKRIAADAIGEDSVDQLAKYGKAAVDAGKRTSQKIGNAINDSDNETIIKARNIAGAVKNAVNDTSSGKQTSNDSHSYKVAAAKCPNCGASLEVLDGIDTFYCQYCGTKVVLENQSSTTIKAKTKVKQLEHEEVMADKIMDHLNTRAERRAEEKRKRDEQSKKMIFILIAIVGVCLVSLFINSKRSEKKSAQEETALQTVVEEIQRDINNGNYDEALIKANGLYYTSNYSSETKKKWNNTRKALIEQIEDLQVTKSSNDTSNLDNNSPNALEETTEYVESNPVSDAVYHSSGNREIAKEGNTGVYSYKSTGGEYDIYFIIDFEEEYIYRFRNDEEICERLKIDSGNLNDMVLFTYHDGSDSWQNAFNFKIVGIPEMAVLQDEIGRPTEFIFTELKDALQIREGKTIKEY